VSELQTGALFDISVRTLTHTSCCILNSILLIQPVERLDTTFLGSAVENRKNTSQNVVLLYLWVPIRANNLNISNSTKSVPRSSKLCQKISMQTGPGLWPGPRCEFTNHDALKPLQSTPHSRHPSPCSYTVSHWTSMLPFFAISMTPIPFRWSESIRYGNPCRKEGVHDTVPWEVISHFLKAGPRQTPCRPRTNTVLVCANFHTAVITAHSAHRSRTGKTLQTPCSFSFQRYLSSTALIFCRCCSHDRLDSSSARSTSSARTHAVAAASAATARRKHDEPAACNVGTKRVTRIPDRRLINPLPARRRVVRPSSVVVFWRLRVTSNVSVFEVLSVRACVDAGNDVISIEDWHHRRRRQRRLLAWRHRL